MQHRSRYGAAVGIHEPGVIREQPAFHRYFPNQIRRLRHFHVVGVRGQIHRTNAEGNGMPHRIHLRIQRDTFGDRMVHAFLHEAVVLVLYGQSFRRTFVQPGMRTLHVLRGVYGLFLLTLSLKGNRGHDGRQHESTANRNCFLHGTSPRAGTFFHHTPVADRAESINAFILEIREAICEAGTHERRASGNGAAPTRAA